LLMSYVLATHPPMFDSTEPLDPAFNDDWPQDLHARLPHNLLIVRDEIAAKGLGGAYSVLFFFSSRRRHTRLQGDWSSDVCSSDLIYGRRNCASSSSTRATAFSLS